MDLRVASLGCSRRKWPVKDHLGRVTDLCQSDSTKSPQLKYKKDLYFIWNFPQIHFSIQVKVRDRVAKLGFEVSGLGECLRTWLALAKGKWMYRLTFEVIWWTLCSGQLEVSQSQSLLLLARTVSLSAFPLGILPSIGFTVSWGWNCSLSRIWKRGPDHVSKWVAGWSSTEWAPRQLSKEAWGCSTMMLALEVFILTKLLGWLSKRLMHDFVPGAKNVPVLLITENYTGWERMPVLSNTGWKSELQRILLSQAIAQSPQLRMECSSDLNVPDILGVASPPILFCQTRVKNVSPDLRPGSSSSQ